MVAYAEEMIIDTQDKTPHLINSENNEKTNRLRNNHVIRFFLGLCIAAMWVIYNIYELSVRLKGYQELGIGDILYIIVTVYGGMVCFLARYVLYCRSMKTEKRIVYKILIISLQSICLIPFLYLLSILYHLTQGKVDWYRLRVYLDFLIALMILVMLQWCCFGLSYFFDKIIVSATQYAKEENLSKLGKTALWSFSEIILLICAFVILKSFADHIEHSMRVIASMDLL